MLFCQFYEGIIISFCQFYEGMLRYSPSFLMITAIFLTSTHYTQQQASLYRRNRKKWVKDWKVSENAYL